MEPVPLLSADIEMIVALERDAPAPELVDRLPDDQRAAITAHVVDERGYAEIAGEAGVAEATVRQRVSRGLATVRRQLGGPW